MTSLKRYGRTQGAASRHGWETGGTDDKYQRWNNSKLGTSVDGSDDYRNEMNGMGHIVEINPTTRPLPPRSAPPWAAWRTKAPPSARSWWASPCRCTWATTPWRIHLQVCLHRAVERRRRKRRRPHGRGRQVAWTAASCTLPSSMPTAPAPGLSCPDQHGHCRLRNVQVCRRPTSPSTPAWPQTRWAPRRWTALSGTP